MSIYFKRGRFQQERFKITIEKGVRFQFRI